MLSLAWFLLGIAVTYCSFKYTLELVFYVLEISAFHIIAIITRKGVKMVSSIFNSEIPIQEMGSRDPRKCR